VVLVEDTETISQGSYPPGELLYVGFADIQHLNRLPFIQLRGMISVIDILDVNELLLYFGRRAR